MLVLSKTIGKLPEIMPIEYPRLYKAHFGIRNEYDTQRSNGKEPLDAFVDGTWKDWQYCWGERERFTRDYIFSMMRFYPDRFYRIWLFGGIYKVINRRGRNDYDVELTDQFEEYVGRAKFKFLKERYSYPNFENVYHRITVVEILPERYGY